MPPLSHVVRALIAALIVIVLVFGAALYAGYRSGVTLAQSGLGPSSGSVADLGLSGLLSGRSTDRELVDAAFQQVEDVYYEPVNAANLVRGERSGLNAFLRAHLKSRAASVPMAAVSSDANKDEEALDQQLVYAQEHFSGALGNDGNSALTQAALDGMLGSLHDPYTVYLPPEQIRALNEQLDGGDFGGIGVFIYQLQKGGVLLEPIEGLPAARAGMRNDEILRSIDGSDIAGKSLDQIERAIRGPQGTTVNLGTHQYKKQKVEHYHITREIIHVPTVHQKMEDGFNYIRLSDFGQTSADEMRTALIAGRRAGAKGTILDLRDNGGGLLDAAVNISSDFIPQGVIVTEINRAGERTPQYATGQVVPGVRPVVILVNQYTASASEITSGALQDYKIATLIGVRTFGKGVVQSIFNVAGGGALKITTSRYVTPSGRDIEHKGIEPNIVVHECANPDRCDLASVIDTPRDRQLNAAKAFLSKLTRNG